MNYERLSPQEHANAAAVGAHGKAAPCDGELVMPVPPGAPPMPTVHPQLGKPTGLWRYHDQSGDLLFMKCRFDPPGEQKEFRPLTVWRNAAGKLYWYWKDVPAPRPFIT